MERKQNRGLITGLILLFVGLMALAGQFMPGNWSQYFSAAILLGLGLAFVVIGIVTRQGGWFIPGGILTGLGAGTGLLVSPLAARLGGDEGGWFLLVFAGGFVLIPILTAIFSDETLWWGFIPGGIIGLVGLALIFGGVFMNTLDWAGKLWPVALIIVGGLLLWRVRRQPVEDEKPMEKHV